MKELLIAFGVGLGLWLTWSTLTFFIDAFRYDPQKRSIGALLFILGGIGTLISLALDFEGTQSLLGLALVIGVIWWVRKGMP